MSLLIIRTSYFFEIANQSKLLASLNLREVFYEKQISHGKVIFKLLHSNYQGYQKYFITVEKFNLFIIIYIKLFKNLWSSKKYKKSKATIILFLSKRYKNTLQRHYLTSYLKRLKLNIN